MKKFKVDDLKGALSIIGKNSNPVLKYFTGLIEKEISLNKTSKFVKANKSYLKTLKYNDVYIRYLKPTDEGYYPGMQGMFKKGTNKLLARHTDSGMLITQLSTI